MNKLLQSLVFILVVCSLVACGFHLREPVDLPSKITPLYIDKKDIDNELTREISSLLTKSGKNDLTRIQEKAKSILTIISADNKRRVVAVDNRGRARQFELSYLVRFSLAGKNLPQVGSDNTQHIHLKREVIFDPDSVLAAGYEIDRLYESMRKDCARLILQRIQALGSDNVGTQNTDTKPTKTTTEE